MSFPSLTNDARLTRLEAAADHLTRALWSLQHTGSGQHQELPAETLSSIVEAADELGIELPGRAVT